MAFIDVSKNSHLERLEYDPIRERRSLAGKYYTACASAFIGATAVALTYKIQRMPLNTGLYNYLLFGGVSGVVGNYLDQLFREQQARKYARIKHYIQLHPEDFPPYPPRLKYADTLQNWYPKRTGW